MVTGFWESKLLNGWRPIICQRGKLWLRCPRQMSAIRSSLLPALDSAWALLSLRIRPCVCPHCTAWCLSDLEWYAALLPDACGRGQAGKQIGSVGQYSWGGAANTIFWIDPEEDLFVIWMTQVLQQDRRKTPIRQTLGNLVYASISDGRTFNRRGGRSRL